jgi:voltage-gated potassium channel Kch
VTVLEISPQLVRAAEECGMDGLVGDGTQRTILERAGIEAARAVVIAIPDNMSARGVVSQCKNLAPEVPVFARSRYHLFAGELQVAGADVIVDEEQSVGELLGKHTVAYLGEKKSEPAVPEGHSAR